MGKHVMMPIQYKEMVVTYASWSYAATISFSQARLVTMETRDQAMAVIDNVFSKSAETIKSKQEKNVIMKVHELMGTDVILTVFLKFVETIKFSLVKPVMMEIPLQTMDVILIAKY